MPSTVSDLPAEAIRELDHLYRTTRDVRLRTRAQIVLLAAEKGLPPAQLAEIVRADQQTVRRWLARYAERGLGGLADAPRPGSPRKVTDDYLRRLLAVIRQPPRELGLPFDRWTSARVAEYMGATTGIRVNPETVRLHLRERGVTLHRPGRVAGGR